MSARRLVALALLPAAAGCLREYTVSEFDELARTSAMRTIVLEDGYSLYSPYDAGSTQRYANLVERHRAEVFALFGIDDAPATIVELRPTDGVEVEVEAEGNGIRVLGTSREPHHGVLGSAGEHVIIAVDAPRTVRLADGREIESAWDAAMFEDTIRHELAHVAVRLGGVDDGDWLHEGMAHAVEWTPVDGGRFVLEPPPDELRAAAMLPRDAGTLERLLDWRQGFPPSEPDRVARLLGLSLVLFVCEREGATVRDGLAHVAALRREDLLALEPEWSAWLGRFATPPRQP